jgi:hypothetical protein
MAIKAISYVIDHAPRDIKPAKLLVLMMLADSAGGDDWSCYPSTRYLADKARVDQRYGKQLLAELAAEGLIEIDRFGGMKTANGYTNRYYILRDGQRFTETREAEITGGNNSAPREVHQGSPKPSVQPSEEREYTPSPEPLEMRLLANDTAAQTNGWQLVDAYAEVTGMEAEALWSMAKKTAAGLARAKVTPDDVRAFMAEMKADPQQSFRYNGYRFNYLGEDLPRWKSRTDAAPAAPSGPWGRELT